MPITDGVFGLLLRDSAHCVKVLALFVICGSVPSQAWAQRGAYFGQSAPAPALATQGFPGFFDTEQLPEGAFIGELPSFGMEYGVSERLSLGTNALLTAPLAFGVPSGFFKSRYRLFSNGSVVSALTGYVGGLIVSPSWGYAAAFTSNTAFVVGNVQTLGISLLIGKSGLQNGRVGDVEYASISGTYGFTFLQYRMALSHEAVLDAVVGAPVLTSAEVDSSGVASSVNVGTGALARDVLFARVILDWRVTESLLLSGGGMAVTSLGGFGSISATVFPILWGIYRFD